jgi:hypothetical protein
LSRHVAMRDKEDSSTEVELSNLPIINKNQHVKQEEIESGKILPSISAVAGNNTECDYTEQ